MLNKLLALVLGASCFAVGQGVRHVVLVNNHEDYDLNWRNAYAYSICGSDTSAAASKRIRVSIESVAPPVIHPKENVYVVLKVENSGKVPVTLPIGEDAMGYVLGTNYRANLDVLAGIPSGATLVGWFELYGSTLRPETLVTLAPGDSIVVEGEMYPHHWFAEETKATAHAALQLYVQDSTKSSVGCVAQDRGTTVQVLYPGVDETH